MLKEIFSSMLARALIILILVFVSLFFIFYFRKDKNFFSTKALTYSSVFLALAVASNQIKIFTLPQGGSVTMFSMFFISYIGYIFGLRVGIVSSITFGLLKVIIKPDIYYPIQFIFDYILAFGALGLSGIFAYKKNSLKLAYIVSVIGRLVFSVLSGYIFFASYVPKGWNPFIYSLWYNFSYLGLEAIITVVILFIPKISNFFEKMKNINYS